VERRLEDKNFLSSLTKGYNTSLLLITASKQLITTSKQLLNKYWTTAKQVVNINVQLNRTCKNCTKSKNVNHHHESGNPDEHCNKRVQ